MPLQKPDHKKAANIMNAYLVIVVALNVAFINCSFCPNNDLQTECLELLCGSDFHVECVDATCTCNPNVKNQCVQQTECYELYFNGTLAFCADPWHCVDNRCKCGGNFGK